MSEHVVKSLGLNLRSSPDPTRNNVIAVLSQGHPVTKLRDASRAGWFEVSARVSGVALSGFLNSGYLAPVDTEFPTGVASGGRLPEADLGPANGAARARASNRAHALGEAGRPGRPSTHASGPAAGILRIIDWLDVGNTTRHMRWKPGGGSTFCNIYVYDVCCLAGCYLPRVWWTDRSLRQLNAGEEVRVKYGISVTELAANYLFDWLKEHGESFGWTRVFSPDSLQAQVNGGRVGIICAQRTNLNSSGHIQIIAPEHEGRTARRVGGSVTQPLQSNAGTSNFTYGHMGSNWWQGQQFRDFGFWTNTAG